MTGETVAHFQILDELPWSGPGALLNARDERDGRSVELLFFQPAQWEAVGAVRLIEDLESARDLRHPHVQQVIDVLPREAGVLVVLEPVRGIPLSQWMARRGGRMNDSLRFAAQTADALSAGHQIGLTHGMVHPDFVIVGDDGFLKLRPFGLAALAPSSPYDAPERAAGGASAVAADVYSFGLLLGELVTGRRSPDSQQQLLKEMLDEQIAGSSSWSEEAAQDFEHVRSGCLAPEPRKRWSSLANVRPALDRLRERVEFASLVGSVPEQVPASRSSIWPWVIGAVIVLPGLIFLTIGTVTRETPQVVRTSVKPLTEDAGYTAEPAVSRDGQMIAFVSDRETPGNLDLYVMSAAGGAARKVSGLPEDEREPAFSPDGRELIYRVEVRGGGLYRVETTGGLPTLFARQGRRPRWSPDGKWIAYWAGSSGQVELGSVYVIPAGGGEPRQIAADFHTAQFPVWAPDSSRILFAGRRQPADYLEFWVADLNRGAPVATGASPALRRQKIPEGIPAVWDGEQLYLTGNDGGSSHIYRMRLEPGTGKVRSQPEPLTAGPDLDLYPALLPGGRLLFSRFRQSTSVNLLPLDERTGLPSGEPRELVNNGASNRDPALSMDGSTLVYSSGRGGADNVWVRDMGKGAEWQVTDNKNPEFHPVGVPSPTGEWVAYSVLENNRTSVYFQPVRGGERQLGCQACSPPADWIPGTVPRLLLTRQGANYYVDILDLNVIRTLTQHKRYPLLNPSISADGNWVAFHAIVGPHKSQIFVVPASTASAIRQTGWIQVTDGVTRDRDPHWNASGTILYFLREQESSRSVWGQRLDPVTRKPQGQPFPVFSVPEPRGVRLADRLDQFETANEKLIYTKKQITGNLWIADWNNGSE